MPPTSFFDRRLEGEDADDVETVAFESVLQECASVLPSRMLRWHYRSQDERLIAFSNRNFYRGDLLTFPSSWAEHPDRGVKFVHVPDAVYGRGGSRANRDEAMRVVEILHDELAADPEAEVAVTGMSIPQANELQARIDASAETDPLVQDWLDRGGRVKNLETIQGDECDVMVLSFGYGRDAAGNLHLNFGPLSRSDGYRRLNVAVTRARRKTILVSSIRASDIPAGATGEGGALVRQYLDYAERGAIVLEERLNVPAANVYESPFEEEVARALAARGWAVRTQVGVSRYRIDIGVLHPQEPGRFIAGIECDGATYHSAETARDRDITRQAVLERLGWNILRVWSPDWYRDPDAVVAGLDRALRALT
jgi:very-short-patch-repair endonuclease